MKIAVRFILPIAAITAGALFLFTCSRPTPPHAVPEHVVASAPVRQTHHFAVPVLMYHRICELTPREARSPLMRDLTVSPADFERQMRYLAENGFTIVTTATVETALRTGSALPEKAVAITMDDGYRDNFTRAYPILRRYHAPATIFVVTGVVATPDHLTWQDMQVMQEHLVGLQSHTVHHYDLATLRKEQLGYELAESKRVLEERLNAPVTQLAYPSGSYNDLVLAEMQATGYAIGWKKGGGPVTPGDDPYLLPRIRVHGRTTMKDFARKVWSGVYLRQQQGISG